MKTHVLLFVSFLLMGLTSFSQETVFPIKGKFQVENDQNLEKRIFNEVQIESNVFHLMKNGEIMESYRLDHTLDRGFHVVQYFQDNVKRDQKRMDVELIEISKTKYQIIIRKGTYEDRLILIKK